MRRVLLTAVTLLVSLVVASSAQAVVVDLSALGGPSVAFNQSSQIGYYGVALVPGSRANLATAGVPTVTSSVPSCDPWLSSDLSLLSSIGLCSHGGAVLHGNETFALTWDPNRSYWATTRDYVEQFLKDVGDGSGTFSSPYALTSQYRDASGRANNASKYGGGCIDYGNPGGYSCQFGNTIGTGSGNSYPASGCSAAVPTDVCLTDAQVQAELTWELGQTQLTHHLMPGYTPLLVLLTPPGVEVCLDPGGKLCSVNRPSTAQFCSYHAQVGGVAYVVQPWTSNTACDEPNLPVLPSHPTAQQLATDAGVRLVNPLSQAQLAAIVNPGLNGWFAQDGSEVNDNNGCAPGGDPYDSVTVGSSSQNAYFISPEFNNAGVVNTDPNTPACALGVSLAPTFVVPSAVESGDVVQFDGSPTVSTLIVPQLGYVWNYGDGTPVARGASVEHSYSRGGTYTVTLAVTDRGGNSASISRKITVLGSSGQPVTRPSGGQGKSALRASLQLLPQGLRAMLRAGVAVRVTSNQSADGIATISISRSAAKRAKLKAGHGAAVVIGRGTFSGLRSGTVKLHLHVSRVIAKRLARLGHVTLTVRFVLMAAGRNHLAIDAAGHY